MCFLMSWDIKSWTFLKSWMPLYFRLLWRFPYNNKINSIVHRQVLQPVSGSTSVAIYVHMQFWVLEGKGGFLRVHVVKRMCRKTGCRLGLEASVPFRGWPKCMNYVIYVVYCHQNLLMKLFAQVHVYFVVHYLWNEICESWLEPVEPWKPARKLSGYYKTAKEQLHCPEPLFSFADFF